LDPFYLIFKGFSAFYLGLSESDGEKRITRMDEAIFSLRKALINDKTPLRAEATYVLGKAYYHKGVDYYNEVIEYLEESFALGYSQTDTWEYLALAAHGAGLRDQSMIYFDKAISQKPDSPELILAAATANATSGNNVRAESLAMEALSLTTDEYLAERCSFLLGDLYRVAGRNEEALARYEAIKIKNPQSADAWYYEGLIFLQSGDPIRARAAWRKAISIDPMHASARLKLSERS
jgi:tetratricopeptide (TPR) repeat protein